MVWRFLESLVKPYSEEWTVTECQHLGGYKSWTVKCNGTFWKHFSTKDGALGYCKMKQADLIISEKEITE